MYLTPSCFLSFSLSLSPFFYVCRRKKKGKKRGRRKGDEEGEEDIHYPFALSLSSQTLFIVDSFCFLSVFCSVLIFFFSSTIFTLSILLVSTPISSLHSIPFFQCPLFDSCLCLMNTLQPHLSLPQGLT